MKLSFFTDPNAGRAGLERLYAGRRQFLRNAGPLRPEGGLMPIELHPPRVCTLCGRLSELKARGVPGMLV